MHSCPYCKETFNNGKILSNHIRWKHYIKKESSIFHINCSCIICKQELTIQNLNSHYNTHFKKIKSYCPHCKSPIYTNNKFCNNSCAALYNSKLYKKNKTTKTKSCNCFVCNVPLTVSIHNSNKIFLCEDCTKKNKTNNRNCYKFYTKLSNCVICGKLHGKKSKTCANTCASKLKSLITKNYIYNGLNINNNRGRGKQSYLEYSFELWIIKNFPNLVYHKEYPFKRKDTIKTYFSDFYFPSKKLIIELDGTQHLKTIKYDSERDSYITSIYDIKIIRISYKEYKTKSKIEEIISILS